MAISALIEAKIPVFVPEAVVFEVPSVARELKPSRRWRGPTALVVDYPLKKIAHDAYSLKSGWGNSASTDLVSHQPAKQHFSTGFPIGDEDSSSVRTPF